MLCRTLNENKSVNFLIFLFHDNLPMNNHLSTPGCNTRNYPFYYYKQFSRVRTAVFSASMLIIFVIAGNACQNISAVSEESESIDSKDKSGRASKTADVQTAAKLDTTLYNKKLLHIINGDTSGHWPVKSGYPAAGAIFPFKRVIAFYGNLYSKRMGILGELEPEQMLEKLQSEVAKWQEADSSIEVIPALHYIAITAQSLPGKGGKYRLRMPFHQIDSVINMAKKINALVFIDIQVGFSTLQEEMPEFLPYLQMPNVHFGIDPEFSMKTDLTPGKIVGSFDAADINYATEYLASLVKEFKLPPKILVIHRFTQGMVKNYDQIKTRPEVQIVMDMDGWGGRAKKINTYKQYIHKEPVQFTGFKIFYKNDTKSGDALLTPQELLALQPQPVYIQYQ